VRDLRARLCYLSCCLLVFGSGDFFLVPLPLFVLVLLVLGSRRRPTGIGGAAFCISQAWRCFGRRLCIKASMYIGSQSFLLHAAIHSLVHSTSQKI
jgi:hypothetical protein